VSNLDIAREAAVGCVTLNRPHKRNAIDDATRDELAQAFANLDADATIRVVILTGAGAAFCAGVDLTTPGNVPVPSGAGATPIVTRGRLTAPLDAFSKPVIAALNGYAIIAIKKALRAATDLPLAAGFELERSLYGALTATQDRAEGRKAFREKRKPDFQGN